MAALSGCDRDLRLGAAAKQEPIKFSTDFQAVFMANGQVFFGKLEGAGTDWPVLKDVYYVQNQVNPETRETASALVKRSNELHGPDRMVLNARQIALIEPVSTSSKVGLLISQAQGATK
jgi:hypothetical protein